MDVIGATQRRSRTIVLGIGTAAGLVFALPVKTGSVSCPPAREGRANCLVQHAWAPAFVKLAAAVLAAWLLYELVGVRLPEAARRWRAGQRPVRRGRGFGREAVLGDSVLAAASWGVVPEERRPAWRVVRPEPSPAAAAAVARILPAAPPPPDAPVVKRVVRADRAVPGVRALGPAERARRGAAAGRIRALDAQASRARRLRRGNDPALVVSCWSDAASARELPDGAAVPA